MEMTNLDNISASSPLVEIISVLMIILNCVILFQDFYSSFRFIPGFFKQIISFIFPAGWKLYINKNVDKNYKKLVAAGAEALIDEDIETDQKPMMTLEEVKRTIEEQLAILEEVDFTGMFEEAPSLEEVKETFGVFDENDDGFIDATELRNVLCRLGFRAASETECATMISAFDYDNDRRIDFSDFVNLLERSFSS